MLKINSKIRSQRKLQSIFKKITTAKYVLTTSSARNGLYLIIKSLNLSGTEIILPGFICASIPAVLMRLNVKPVFVDVDHSFTIKTNNIKGLINEIYDLYNKKMSLKEISEKFDLPPIPLIKN